MIEPIKQVELKSTNLWDRFIEYSFYVLDQGYIVDDENRKPLAEIFQVIEEGKYGIVLYGNPGSGKTLILKMIQKIIPPYSPLFFTQYHCDFLVDEFSASGRVIFKKYKSGNILFDDLGTEGIGRHFKDELNVFEKIIQERNLVFEKQHMRTFYTTNLLQEELFSRYGKRCESRLMGNSEHIILGGSKDSTDRRKLKNFKGLPPVFHPSPEYYERMLIKELYKKMIEHPEDYKTEIIEPFRNRFSDFITKTNNPNQKTA